VIAYIFLVNLLIAMFNNTYSDIQEEASSIWRLQSWQLLQEFIGKTVAPPPFEIFVLIYRYCFPPPKDSNKLTAEEIKTFTVTVRFEETSADAFLEKKHAADESLLERQVEGLQESIHHVRGTVNELHRVSRHTDDTQPQENSRDPDELDK
jgi:transient receptor potential cation channel subfamily M protein 2